MQTNYKGAVTIYLMLIFPLLCSLFIACIHSARYSMCRLETEKALELGLLSTFAEFNRELLERYDIFGIDTSYGTKNASYHYTEQHLLEYTKYNLNPSYNIPVYGVNDVCKLQTDLVEINAIELLTDNGGKAFKKQAIEYIKTNYGISFIEGIINDVTSVSDNALLETDVDTEREIAESTISKAEQDGIQISEDEWVEVSLDNPANKVNANRTKGILNFTVKDVSSLSNNAVDLSVYHSKRELSKGNFSTVSSDFSLIDNIIFNEYCVKKMGCYTNPATDEPLQYQLEYLLEGHNSDIENLRGVCNTLVLMREVANLLYLMTDSLKVAEADALALTITSALLAPYLQPVVKYTLLAAWAYAESVVDVKHLLSGDKVPIIKSKKDWNLSLEGMLDYDKFSGSDGKNEKGLDYTAYLRVLLAIEKEDKVVNRAMDLVEMYMRLKEGNHYFRLDACISSVHAKIRTRSRYGFMCKASQQYSYVY